MTTASSKSALAEGILESVQGEQIVLRVPQTDYRLQLVPAGEPPALAALEGKRVRGTIEARALRIHAASGGGRFIEPVVGAPRIVAGMVVDVNAANRKVLVLAAVPIWLHYGEQQKQDVLTLGGLINCHVESGMWITLESA